MYSDEFDMNIVTSSLMERELVSYETFVGDRMVDPTWMDVIMIHCTEQTIICSGYRQAKLYIKFAFSMSSK